MLTQEQLKNLKVGQTLWYVHINYKGGSETTVEKIGREYFYTDRGRKFTIKDGYQQTDYQGGELFIDERAYQDKVYYNNRIEELRELLNYGNSINVPITDIEEFIGKLESGQVINKGDF